MLFAFTFWYPHFGAVTCVQSGRDRLPLKSFLMLLIPFVFFWDFMWGALIYNFGPFFKENIDKLFPVFIAYLIIWILFDLFKDKFKLINKKNIEA